MSHYWTANDSTEARQMQIEDWLEDLREFGSATVESACQEWRHIPGGRRPTPGDIRAICARDRVDRTPLLTHGAEDPDAWARSLGWESYRERQDAIERNDARLAASLGWQAESAVELRAGRVRGFKSVAASLDVTDGENDRG